MKRKTRKNRKAPRFTIRNEKAILRILTATPVRTTPAKYFVPFSYAADDIVQQIIDHMIVVAAASGKTFSATAFDEWRVKLKESVKVNLLAGGSWANDKTNVLVVAGDMATIAAIITGSNNTVISRGRVHAAFRAVKEHAACPGVGSGAWCNFDI